MLLLRVLEMSSDHILIVLLLSIIISISFFVCYLLSNYYIACLVCRVLCFIIIRTQQITIDGKLCSIGPIHLLGRRTRCVLQLRTTRLSWNMIQIHCNSAEVKELAPKGILYPTGNIFYNHQCKPAFVSFTFKTDSVVVKSEGGQVMSQISAVNRQLHYGPDMDDDKTCS